MTAVFPSSTSITCCTSNLKSWRSVERREGAGWASMADRGRQCDISGWACASVSLVTINSSKKLTHCSGGAPSPSSNLSVSRGVYRRERVARVTAWGAQLGVYKLRGRGVENSMK